MHEWVTITRVFGEYVLEPTKPDMEKALGELFAYADQDHPDTWIECGSESGPLYCISVFSSGYAIYTKYSDADMTDEIEKKEISPVNLKSALALWSDLVDGITP